MLEIKDIDKLAKLSRIELTEAEKESILKEIDPILNYIGQLKEVISDKPLEKKAGMHRNISRIDTNPNENGKNTESIVGEFPENEDNYLKVKKIL